MVNKTYNSRERKIYSDYNKLTTEALYDIFKRKDDYNPEVINIVRDILEERNVLLRHEKEITSSDKDKPDEGQTFLETERHYEKYKSFVTGLTEKSWEELNEIIVRYSFYQIEKVEAALYVSVEKGFLDYDLKEQLLKQIKENLDKKWVPHRRSGWEKENAFKGYVSRYNDEEIYTIIDNPSDIVIDVYHAVIVTARERELISEDDLKDLFKRAKIALKSDEEIRKEEVDQFIGIESSKIFEDEASLEEEKLKYWKCPSCHELVGVELDVCWNCQATIPEIVEHPDTEEVVKETIIEKGFDPSKFGIRLIIIGVVITGISFIPNHSYHWLKYDYLDMAFGIIAIIAGLVFIIFRPFDPLKKI